MCAQRGGGAGGGRGAGGSHRSPAAAARRPRPAPRRRAMPRPQPTGAVRAIRCNAAAPLSTKCETAARMIEAMTLMRPLLLAPRCAGPSARSAPPRGQGRRSARSAPDPRPATASPFPRPAKRFRRPKSSPQPTVSATPLARAQGSMGDRPDRRHRREGPRRAQAGGQRHPPAAPIAATMNAASIPSSSTALNAVIAPSGSTPARRTSPAEDSRAAWRAWIASRRAS